MVLVAPSTLNPLTVLFPATRADALEIVSETASRLDDEEERIPDDFYYDFAEHMSKPVITEESGLPPNLLQLQYPLSHVTVCCVFFP